MKEVEIENERYKRTIDDIENQILLYSKSYEQHYYWLNGLNKMKPSLIDKITQADFDNFENQLNFGGYLYISILDLLSINKNFILSKYLWEKLHQIRLAYLIIYSLIETYNKHSTQLKQSSLKNETLNILFLEITKDLKLFKKDNNYPDSFKDLRNFTLGHIDQSLTHVYETIIAIDPMKSYQTILDFLKIIFKIHTFATENVNTLELNTENGIYLFDRLTNEFEMKLT